MFGAKKSPPLPLTTTAKAPSERTETTTSSRSNESNEQRLPKIGETEKKSSLFGPSWWPGLSSASEDHNDPLASVEPDIECPAMNEQERPDEKEQESPAIAMARQLQPKRTNAADGVKKERNWGKSRRAIGGTFALAVRDLKGLLSTSIVLALLLSGNRRDTSTYDSIKQLADREKENIQSRVNNTDYLMLFDDYIDGIVEENNSEFELFLKQGLEDQKCEAQLTASLHDELLKQQSKYDGLVEKTQEIMKKQDALLQELEQSIGEETLGENVQELNDMIEVIEEIKSALAMAKEALMDTYRMHYDEAKYNIAAAQDTLDRVQQKVSGALNRMSDTSERIQNQSEKGPVRKKILGKASEALQFVEEQLNSIGSEEFVYQEPQTPEDYRKTVLDPQFADQEELLIGLQDSAELIKKNCEDGIVTLNTISEAHKQSSAELQAFIDEQNFTSNLLKSSESILELYDTEAQVAKDYVETTKNKALNATKTQLDDIPETVNEEVDELFEDTVLSDEAKEVFDRWDRIKNGTFFFLSGIAAASTAYIAIATGWRANHEMRNEQEESKESKQSWGEWAFNKRYKLKDKAGVKYATVDAAKKTGVKKRGMRCEKGRRVAMKFIKDNPLTGVMLLVWLGTLVRDVRTEFAFRELKNQADDRVTGVKTALTDARGTYRSRLVKTCQTKFENKLSVVGLQKNWADTIKNKTEIDPDFNSTVTFVKEHQPPECQNSTLNEALRYQDMTAEEILEGCERVANRYLDEYFDQNFNQDQYHEEMSKLTDNLNDEDEGWFYSSTKWFDHWVMGLLFAAVIYEQVKLASVPYENPDEHGEKNMNAENRGWFQKKDQKAVPEQLAEMHHLLTYLKVEIGGKPLLEMDDSFNHMAGYDPKDDKEYEGEVVHWDSTKDKDGWSSWLPWKKSLTRADKAKVDQVRELLASKLDGVVPKERLHYILEREIMVVDVQEFQVKTSKQGWLNKAIDKVKEKMPFVNIEEPESAEQTSERTEESTGLEESTEALSPQEVEMVLYRKGGRYKSDYIDEGR